MSTISQMQQASTSSIRGEDGRYRCPFEECGRVFTELWRLKVHCRAPVDNGGSRCNEQGHGEEVDVCRMCFSVVKPGSLCGCISTQLQRARSSVDYGARNVKPLHKVSHGGCSKAMVQTKASPLGLLPAGSSAQHVHASKARGMDIQWEEATADEPMAGLLQGFQEEEVGEHGVINRPVSPPPEPPPAMVSSPLFDFGQFFQPALHRISPLPGLPLQKGVGGLGIGEVHDATSLSAPMFKLSTSEQRHAPFAMAVASFSAQNLESFSRGDESCARFKHGRHCMALSSSSSLTESGMAGLQYTNVWHEKRRADEPSRLSPSDSAPAPGAEAEDNVITSPASARSLFRVEIYD